MSPSVSVRLLLTQSDARLVGYARTGHERAFEALVRRYRRQLLGYCRRLLLSDERAEDALQQALLQAWVALRDGAEIHDVRPWLYRIVHNAAVNALRVSDYDYCKLSESLSGADAPQADLDRRIAVREALAGLAALPEMQREALLRTAVDGCSHQQVASDLGLSEPALRGLVYRARAALRAAAGAIVPPPLLSWALEAGTRGTPALERVAGVAGGGGSAGLAGLLVKGGAVAVTAGALAGGLAAAHTHKARAHSSDADRPGARAAARTAAARTASTTADQSASVRPASFTRPAKRDAPSRAERRFLHPAPTGGGESGESRRPRSRAPRPFAPIPAAGGQGVQPHSAGTVQGDEGPHAGVSAPSGKGSGGASSLDGHGEAVGAASASSGSGSGEQKGDSGSLHDGGGGGGSTGSGHEGSGEGSSGPASGSGEPSSGDGGDSHDGSDDSQPSESAPGGGPTTSGSTSGTTVPKDTAGVSGEGPAKQD